MLTPQEKRKATIIKKYGSFVNMLKKRDVRDLVLGGYNGGLARTSKGFAKWQEGELSIYAKKRQRDNKGRFVSNATQKQEVQHKNTAREADR